MQNEFLSLLLPGCPASILGVIVGDGKFVAKVKFSNGSNMRSCSAWVVDKFCRWAKCSEAQVDMVEDGINNTVEARVKP